MSLRAPPERTSAHAQRRSAPTKKQTKSKQAGSSRKAPKTAVAAPKAPRTRERDPRIPAAGTVLKRTYKGAELKVTVLEDGFRFEGEEFRSLSALAAKVTGYKAVNGVAWMNLAGPRAATPKPVAAQETAAEPMKTRTPKRAAKVRRAGRDPRPVAPMEAAPEVAPAGETATT